MSSHDLLSVHRTVFARMDDHQKAKELKHCDNFKDQLDEVNNGDSAVDIENVTTPQDQTASRETDCNSTDSVDNPDKEVEELLVGEDVQGATVMDDKDTEIRAQDELLDSTAEQTKPGESVAKDVNYGNSRSTNDSDDSHSALHPNSISAKKAKRRAIFVSYAPEGSFLEKRFIAYTIKELKNIGFCDDIWFDKDDGSPLESPFCFQQRLETAEKCRASIMFLSESYFSSRVCRHERLILLNRDEDRERVEEKDKIEKPVKLFCIKYSHGKLPSEFKQLGDRFLDLSSFYGSSAAELSSIVVGAFSEDLEKYAPMFGLRIPTPPDQPAIVTLDRKKPITSWNISDVLAWLSSLKMQAHCSLSFEENEIDGFLLVSASEMDLEIHLNVDSRVARKKLVQQIKKIREDQALSEKNWHLKCQKIKAKEDSVYVICDPNDVSLYHTLRSCLVNKNMQVKFIHD